MASKVDVAFRPGGDTWQSLSPKLIVVRRLILAIFAGVLLVAAAIVALTPAPKWIAALIAGRRLVGSGDRMAVDRAPCEVLGVRRA